MVANSRQNEKLCSVGGLSLLQCYIQCVVRKKSIIFIVKWVAKWPYNFCDFDTECIAAAATTTRGTVIHSVLLRTLMSTLSYGKIQAS